MASKRVSMTPLEVFIFISIHIVVPLIGVFCYFGLIRRFKQLTDDVPVISIFLLFLIYGIALCLLLTSFFWKWSGMASIGAFFLMLIAPIIALGIAFTSYRKRKINPIYKYVFYASLVHTLQNSKQYNLTKLLNPVKKYSDEFIKIFSQNTAEGKTAIRTYQSCLCKRRL